jgi:CubicO group peptidase (beta-lactamase class C family)
MVRARHRPALALLAVLGAGMPAGAEPTRSEPRAALDPLARSLIDGEHCAGLVVALISPGAPPRMLAWGETVRGNGKPPDANTVFEIGSISKVFTSLLLAEMVLDKQVALDTPVASLLPPGAKLPASKRAITLLDLSTHMSGLPRMPDNHHSADADNPYADYTRTSCLRSSPPRRSRTSPAPASSTVTSASRCSDTGSRGAPRPRGRRWSPRGSRSRSR